MPALHNAIQSLDQIHDKLTQTNDLYWANQIDIERQELVALLSLLQAHPADALSTMRRAADMEDKTESATVTPGPFKPAREMLAELLLEQKQPADALKEFQATLQREPNRFWSLYGAAQAATQARDPQTAALYFQKLLAIASRADQPGRPELAEARTTLHPN